MELDATRRVLEATWRMEAGKLVALLTRLVRDVSLAEDLAQDAFLAALAQWPEEGVPDRPGAWLLATARHRALDRMRRETRTVEAEADPADAIGREPEEVLPEDTLRVLFLACHPVLSDDARTALALKLLCGLGAEEIGRAFLVPGATIAQRIVRAKRTLVEEGVAFEDLNPAERHARLGGVLEVIYLLFNEGYAATTGDDWMRESLCEEAMRLGRVLAELEPREPEVHGLLALMELTASRAPARTDAEGRPVLLLEQDRSRWDRLLLRRGLTALDRALALAGRPGSYALQAGIAACHARASTPDATDWRAIVALYDELLARTASPVVALNRAVAVSMADGPAAALPLVESLEREAALASYHLLPSVRGDLLRRLGRTTEARREFERAAALTQNRREAELLRRRAAES